MNNVSKSLIVCTILTGLIGCTGGGGSGGGSSRGVASKVRVGQIGSTNTRANSVEIAAIAKWGDVAQTAGNYSWAKVEGMKIELTNIRGSQGADLHSFKSFSGDGEIEMGGDTGAINLQADISIPAGDYTEVGVEFKNAYSVKGFCRTNNKSLYTTATGIKECTVNCGVGDDLPNDYDYYTYNFMLPEAPDGSTVMESIKSNFSIAEGSVPKLTILVDTSFTVACADSDADIDDSNDAGSMAPFKWMLQNGVMSDYYLGTEGNFGVGYLPIFTYVTTDANAALPIGETYAASGIEASIEDGNEVADLVNAMITTVAFDANDNTIAARSRNFSGDHQTDLQQGWSGFSTDAANSYTLMNGEHWSGAAADYSEARWFMDRKIVGFARSINYTSRQTIDVVDGPECGMELSDRNRDCQTGGPVTTYWKRVKR